MGPCGRLADSALLAALAQRGTAVLQDSAPAWCDPQLPTWHDAVAGLAQPCVCPQANVLRLFCCWTCGGAAWPPAGRNPSPCPFCKASVGVPCAFCTLARSAVGTTAPTQLISVQTRPPSARTAGSCGPAACKLAHCVAVLCPLWTTSYSTSGSLPTLAKQELAPRQLSPPCCGLSTFGGGYWLKSANAVAQISTACSMPWRRTAPCSACSFWPRKHSARRASPPCNETSLCRSRCKKNVPRLCTACFFLASGRSRLPSFFSFFFLFLHAKIMLSRSLSRLSPSPFAHFTSPPPPSSGPNPPFQLKL